MVSHRPKKRPGFSIIEVVLVVTILTIVSGMAWNILNTSDRIPRERGIWRDLERISIATRLYRMERGQLPPNIETLESVGYVGKFIPPAGVVYGFVDNGVAITIFAGTNKTNPSTVVRDYFSNEMKIVITK